MEKLCRCLLILLGLLSVQEKAKGTEENSARLGVSSQSSNYDGLVSSYAVDGLRDSYSHTNAQTDPWWRVDLLNVYKVNRVVITNKDSSYYYTRINGAVIRVGNVSQDFYSNPICAVISTIPSNTTETFYCDGMEGRYVHIHIPGDGKIMTVKEIEVYGFIAGNVALDGVATQSSTFEDWSADRGIDGDRGLLQQNTGCAETAPGNSNPWWRLDLRDVYHVIRVVITNGNDCCPERVNGAEIRIGNSLENNGNNNPLCAVIPGIPAGQSYTYPCGGMVGRYVNVFRPGTDKILTMCEVEVYVEDICKQRAAVKMRFSSKEDLTDSTIAENILQQLGSILAGRGFKDVIVQWSQPPQQDVIKVEEKRPCS
ncbi:uncharacterized protein LOC130550823 [Triplophysa rosa]|uniref:Fucolectin tachylectin-4 pentraxin-1 domain-containing protein n=1 Tax=Triplophysa rosa TaxID=992332 RepID=A0A9W7W9P6_TRIRA|nr:uncharacterized protein LOC130550823 [Triplophysa rosa]KAI7790233.1 hypothetical protein IRJ41_012914 [Triplophysa rosa]